MCKTFMSVFGTFAWACFPNFRPMSYYPMLNLYSTIFIYLLLLIYFVYEYLLII